MTPSEAPKALQAGGFNGSSFRLVPAGTELHELPKLPQPPELPGLAERSNLLGRSPHKKCKNDLDDQT